jgi:hypothetical protein
MGLILFICEANGYHAQTNETYLAESSLTVHGEAWTNRIGCKVVHCHAQGSPAGDHNGEHAKPDGHCRDDDEGWGGDGTHYIGPHPGAVHEAHPDVQL